MPHEQTEYVRYSRDQLEEMVKWNARAKLVGDICYGEIGQQELRWNEDGSVEVLTTHTPSRARAA